MRTREEISYLPQHEQENALRMAGHGYEADQMAKSNSRSSTSGANPIFLFLIGGALLLFWLLKDGLSYAVVQFESDPISLFSNPFFIIIPLLFSYRYFAGKVISVIFITLSFPAIVGFVYFSYLYAADLLNSSVFSKSPDLLENVSMFYNYAYGKELGESINFMHLSERMAVNIAVYELSMFSFALKILNWAALAVGAFFLYEFYTLILLKINFNKTEDINADWGHVFYSFVVMIVTYGFCLPFIEMTSQLPYGLNFVVAWSIFLFPLLGICLAKSNYYYIGKDKNATYITYYYIAFFLTLICFIGQTDSMNVLEMYRNKSAEASDLFLVIPLFSFYILIKSLKNKKMKPSN